MRQGLIFLPFLGSLVALWPAILRFVATWAALILRLRPAGCDLGSAKLHKYRGGLGLRFSNRSVGEAHCDLSLRP